MTETQIRATPPLELHTPWKSSQNGKPHPPPHSQDRQDSSDRQALPPISHNRPSSDRSTPHRASTTEDISSEPAGTAAGERTVISATIPDAQPAPERGPTPGQRRTLSVISAMSCSMCSATGVNSLWRRDRAGKPICGKCCEQLRRRMNPRYAVTSRGDMSASRPPAHTLPIRRRTPSPNGRPAPYPARSPIRNGYPQSMPYVNGAGNGGTHPPPGNGRPNGNDRSSRERYNIPSYADRSQPAENGRHDNGNHLTLPPLSSIERVADHYRRDRDPNFRIKEPVSLPAAATPRPYARPNHMMHPTPSMPLPDHRRADSRISDRTQDGHGSGNGMNRLAGGAGIVTEQEIQQKRALLVEGRKWIFSMLDETTAMLRQLDEASLHVNAPE